MFARASRFVRAAGTDADPLRPGRSAAICLAVAIAAGAGRPAGLLTARDALVVAVAGLASAPVVYLVLEAGRCAATDRLDRWIAAGCGPPPPAAALRRRREELTSVRHRHDLARALRRLAADAQRPPAITARVTVDGTAIRAELIRIGRIADLLDDTATPVGSRGVALVEALVTDGRGPAYGRAETGRLATALTEALAQLEPAALSYPRSR